jgi:hypothetical protein
LNLNLAATSVFVALFLFATWLGFVAAHWRKADLNILHESISSFLSCGRSHASAAT